MFHAGLADTSIPHTHPHTWPNRFDIVLVSPEMVANKKNFPLYQVRSLLYDFSFHYEGLALKASVDIQVSWMCGHAMPTQCPCRAWCGTAS